MTAEHGKIADLVILDRVFLERIVARARELSPTGVVEARIQCHNHQTGASHVSYQEGEGIIRVSCATCNRVTAFIRVHSEAALSDHDRALQLLALDHLIRPEEN